MSSFFFPFLQGRNKFFLFSFHSFSGSCYLEKLLFIFLFPFFFLRVVFSRQISLFLVPFPFLFSDLKTLAEAMDCGEELVRLGVDFAKQRLQLLILSESLDFILIQLLQRGKGGRKSRKISTLFLASSLSCPVSLSPSPSPHLHFLVGSAVKLLHFDGKLVFI